MLEVFLNIFNQGFDQLYIKSGHYIQISVAISIAIATGLSLLCYIFPRLWNTTYQNTTLTTSFAILSFISTNILVFIFCILLYYANEFPKEFREQLNADIPLNQWLFSLFFLWSFIQLVVFGLLGRLAYKDIRIRY